MKCMVFAGKPASANVKSARETALKLGQLGHEVDLVAFAAPGQDTSAFASCGANRVLRVESADFETYDPGVFCAQLSAMVADLSPDAVFFSHTYSGREMLARLAQQMGVPAASDITSIEALEPGRLVYKRMVYGGKAYETVEQAGSPVFASVRPGALRTDAVAEGETEAADYPVKAGAADALLQLMSFQSTATGRPGLEEADVVVSIGRGCNERARQLAGELADLLGAAVGSSRGMVDSGVAGYELQVGQTGKSVAPHLYIACGISGSIQHQAGMSRSELIVAINTDENAPIFEIADYGIVADAEQVLDNLVAGLKAR